MKLWTLCVCALVPACAYCEMFTSLLDVRQAIGAERKLIGHLRTYIHAEWDRLQDIRRFYAKVSSVHNELNGGPSDGVANPLLAFTLIKRLHADWLNVVYSDRASDNAQALRWSLEQEEDNLPKGEDVRGAARGLMRLQDVYALHVASLAAGRFRRASGGRLVDVYTPAAVAPLSADDCLLLGKVAYDQGDYYHSVPWLRESVELFRRSGGRRSPENGGTLEDALDHLAFSHFQTGNISRALSLSQELLHHDPTNGRVSQNVAKYEKLLAARAPVSPGRPASKYLRTRDAYERLCQTPGPQPTRADDGRLFCDYFTNGSPALRLLPARREVLSLRPRVVLYHDFVTERESESIKNLARTGLRRSVVAAGEKQATADYRISKRACEPRQYVADHSSAWLKDSAHATVGKLDRRIATVTGLDVTHPFGEHLQVVNYGIGGHYEPHFDHATSPSSPVFRLNTGNRVATFMIYLSSVEAGGSTAFIYGNFSVPVVKNSAIFWWNLHRNGGGDDDTLHAGCPVLVGDKWVANKWIHEYGQEFRRGCGLNREE
ncbi:prolyl 4-hydroxylase subunit alpha-3 isoform X1 [Phyllopteryx taeniolatus]|uniref:prolyl 4-hydroxylase subunit alpha-3 isoform X1 n=1 Tax=Phyllopteryx taeniolatus TaxID=161469 RepID=UPI002AD54C90|nr:prolyl 4-hydroxylase subunit alpha-3 isoform X1 [Phyllopteryx taeniolatus]